MWHPSVSRENNRLGPVLTDRESVPTASCSTVSPFLRLDVTEPSRMKSVRTKGCHVGLFWKFVGMAFSTYGQSNPTNESFIWHSYLECRCHSWHSSVLYITPAYTSSIQELIIQLEKSCFLCRNNIWHDESNYILQPPKYLIIILIGLDMYTTIFPKICVRYPWKWPLNLVSINSACMLP